MLGERFLLLDRRCVQTLKKLLHKNIRIITVLLNAYVEASISQAHGYMRITLYVIYVPIFNAHKSC